MSGFIFAPAIAKQSQFLGRVVVADSQIEPVDLAALALQAGDDLLGEGFLFGHAPAEGGRIAHEGDARHA